MNVGGRVDYFDFNKEWNYNPRLSASYRVASETTIRAAWGLYYQSPIYRQIAYSVASDTNTQAQKATHYILGVEHKLPLEVSTNSALTLRLEGYYKKYDDLISSTRASNGRIDYSRRNDATGYARGIDLYAVLNRPGFYGWLSYGLLNAKEDLINDNAGAFPRYTDQRLTLSAVGDVGLGKRWSLNARIFYGSGYAYTPLIALYNQTARRWEWIAGEKNSAHLPAYKRVDVRVSWQFKIGVLSVNAFLDISNIFNFTNIQALRYGFTNSGLPLVQDEELWPIVPTLGMTIKY